MTEEHPARSGPDRLESDRPETVTLSIPARTRHAATARVVAASLAADLGFDVDAIDDLRLGVNEAVALVLDGPADADRPTTRDRNGDHATGTLDITFTIENTIENTRIGIEISHAGSSADVEFDELADRILSVVVDHHSHSAGVVRLVKSLRDAS